MDVQHEDIFGRIESLKTLAFETNTLPIEKVHTLIDCLSEHFATEERLAQETKIEFLVHGQEHARNLRLLKKAVGELENGKLDRHTFLRYIEYWFEQHIADFDKRFAARLAEAKKQP
jgi:hemerythrin-like metal-binding protein